jgi:N-acetylmuramoyl-L-alanine amidase
MYNQGDTQSEKYAKNISNALTSNPMLVPQRQNQANSGYIGELNQKPGDINLLAEMGFFSNPTECKKCVNDEQVDFIARTMGNELIQILNEINNSKGEMQLWQI